MRFLDAPLLVHGADAVARTPIDTALGGEQGGHGLPCTWMPAIRWRIIWVIMPRRVWVGCTSTLDASATTDAPPSVLTSSAGESGIHRRSAHPQIRRGAPRAETRAQPHGPLNRYQRDDTPPQMSAGGCSRMCHENLGRAELSSWRGHVGELACD